MYLCFSISNSITQKKWEKVYEETLVLAQQLNLVRVGRKTPFRVNRKSPFLVK